MYEKVRATHTSLFSIPLLNFDSKTQLHSSLLLYWTFDSSCAWHALTQRFTAYLWKKNWKSACHAHFNVSHSSTKLRLNYAPLYWTLTQLCVRHARFQRFTANLWKSTYHAHFTLYFSTTFWLNFSVLYCSWQPIFGKVRITRTLLHIPSLNFDSTSLFSIALDRQSLIKCISREILFCHNSQFSFDARNHYLTLFYSISTQTVL